METVTNSLVKKLGSDSGVDTTGNGTDNLGSGANEGSNALDLGANEVLHGPALLGLANANGKVLEENLTLLGVSHLGVELNTPDRLSLVGDGSKGRVGGVSNNLVASGEVSKLVTVRHPNLKVVNALEQRVTGDLNVDGGMAVLAVLTGMDVLLAVDPSKLLHTVADTQDGDAKLEDVEVNVRSVLVVDRVRTARENDTLGLPGELGDLLSARQHLGVDVELTQAAGDQMTVLGTEIENQNGIENVGNFNRLGHSEIYV